MLRIALAVLTGLCALAAQAALPAPASLDRSHWPETLDSPVLFDVASRAEILAFGQALHDSEMLDDRALSARLGLRQVNLVAVRAVRARMWQRLLTNYRQALLSCDDDASFCFPVETLDDLRTQSAGFASEVGSFYQGWVAPSHQFHQRYLDAQLRKAALTPQTSSEVLPLSSRELSGTGLPDRVFLLTFEGGPDALTTPALTDYLRRQHVGATFFVLGTRLQQWQAKPTAVPLRQLYADQCVGLMGWEYRSHAQWQSWQESLRRSQALVRASLPDRYVPLFRPPYGQRQAQGQAFLDGLGIRVSLWNIEAHDDSSLSAEQSAQRVLTLMLLWRKGVIQFHDSSARAQPALHWLLQQTANSGIAWADCQAYGQE